MRSIKSITEMEKGVLALILLAANFASIGLFIRYLNTGFTLLQQVYLRIFAAFIFGLVLFSKNLSPSKLKKIPSKDWSILLTRAIGGYLLGVPLFSLAIIEAKYSNVSFIGALPVTAFFGVLLFKEKLSFKKLLLIIGGFVGAVLISVKDYSHLSIWGRGEIYAFLSTLIFSFTYIIRKWQSETLNNQEISVIVLLIGFVSVFLTSIYIGESFPTHGWSTGLFLAVLGAGLFNTINQFLVNYGFQKVEAILASNLLMLESVFAIIFGFLFFRELPNPKELIGGLTIVLSVIAMNQLEIMRVKNKT